MNTLSTLAWAAIAGAFLPGCATRPPPKLNPVRAQSAWEARTLRDSGLEAFLTAHGQPPGGEWSLDRLTLAAFQFSPELDVARARVAAAEAATQTARARPNPVFTFTPGYNADALGGVTPWILGYALNFPLELAGRRTHRTAEAQHRLEAARFDLAQAAWAVRSTVRRALSDVQAAEATAGHWRTQRPLLAQVTELVEEQVKAGEVSPLEAAKAQIALHRAELAARENDRALAAARSSLAEAVGVPLAALEGVALSYRDLAEPAAPVDAADARRWAAVNRGDLLAALAHYEASQSALQAELVRHFADWSLGPGYELDQGEGKWSLALGLPLPLFHRNQGPLAEARARRETAAAEFLALQNRVMGEVDRAAALYIAALGDLATAQAMRASLEQQARVALAQQNAGETSRLDLARARIELADHTRAELEARLRVTQSLGAFEDAVQRPLAWPETAWRRPSRTAAN